MDIKEFLDADGGIALKLAIHKLFSDLGDDMYTEVCGGFIEGVYQWSEHNIYDIVESENVRFLGWTICFSDGKLRRMYIEKSTIDFIEKKATDWKHAKNIFCKNVKAVIEK